MGNENKKYIVNADGALETVLVGINVHGAGGSREKKICINKKEAQRSMQNYSQRVKQRAKMVHALSVNNFDPAYSAMLTLTFGRKPECTKPKSELTEAELHKIWNDNMIERVMGETMGAPNYQDLNYCKRLFQNFIKRVNYAYDGFHYLAVSARQEMSQHWHYHVLCNLTCVDEGALDKLWKNGIVHIWKTNTNNFEKAWKYLVKNMGQEGAESLVGVKGYLFSRGLNPGRVYRSWREGEIEACYEVEKQLKQCGSHPKVSHISEAAEGGGFCKYYKHKISFDTEFPKVPPATPR